MRRYISFEIKNTAVELRKKGGSIGEIARNLGVSKSTAYEWTKNIEGAARFAEIGRERWMKELQPLGALGQKRKREKKISQIVTEVQKELGQLQLTPELKKAVLASLYWAEGAKGRGMLKFANTDPRLMSLFITLLRQSYILDERKFRVGLQLHWYHRDKKAKEFWSELLKIPDSQFHKIYHKKRSKEHVFRKNIGGICFLQYNSDALREQIVHFAFAFGEKITGKIDAPVA